MTIATRGSANITQLRPSSDWGECAHGGHLVQFYEDDAFLTDALTRFIGRALDNEQGAIVIGTQTHRDALEARLKVMGHDVSSARKNEQYVDLDAAETLSKFMVRGRPDERQFVDSVGGVIDRVSGRYPNVQAFGEMVALLWSESNSDAAIELEKLWNSLAKTKSFTLCCAYPINGFSRHVHGAPFLEVCAEHTHVIPAESYLALTSADERQRTVAELQQKTAALQTEIVEHMKTHEALQNRLKELAENDRRKNEFLAMLGHELRNPLSPILSALEILKMPDADTAAIRTAHDAIGHQTRHLAHIVDDLLDVTRINTGKIQLRDELVELSTVLRRAVEITRPLVDAKRHRISISLPNRSVLVKGDATRLEQIFTNLLTNAAKYMNASGEVSLAAAIAGNEVAVSVKDKGVGISADLLPRIFELFTQAERSLDRSLGGLGVGLWMVRRLVELHGGSVEVDSDPGKGSTFVVRLPLASLSAQAANNESARAPGRLNSVSPCRIMVVDDNRDAADMLGILLRMQGHVVQVAHDGFAAVQMAPTFNPDVILLDIGLPGLDGYAVARQLRRLQNGRSLCLIALTGYGQDEDRERSRAAGFDHHIVKPVEPSDLSELLLRAQQPDAQS